MAKINVPKSFDKGQIDSDLLGKLEPFIDYVNQNFEQTTSALNNSLSFADNIKCISKTLQAKHLTPVQVNLGSANVVGFLILNSTAPLRSYSYTQTAGLYSFTFRFDEPITISSKSITIASGIATVETNDTLQAGDMINLSKYATGTLSNNGNFLVSYVYTTAPSKVAYYNPSGATTETLGAYTSSSIQTRSVSIIFLTS